MISDSSNIQRCSLGMTAADASFCFCWKLIRVWILEGIRVEGFETVMANLGEDPIRNEEE